MDKYSRREFYTKGIIGAVGCVVSLIAYLLVNHDLEIKKRISDVEASSRVCERISEQNTSGVAELFHAVQRIERACCQWGDKK